ncbi:MAG TPA: zf-HC2 domain-containing protein [Acidimicrobiales bacterium]|nr:zf-HC2 domain-containing protein [Acidimicrobiales bacterium]
MSGRFGSGGFGAHDHLGDALSALLDGELPSTQERAARAHIADCPDCAHELLAVTEARTWVRALPLVEPPFGLYERMLLERPQRVGATFDARAALRRRAGIAAFGAAAAAVTVLGVASPSQPPVSPAVPRMVEAHATSASVGADLLSKLAPVGVPVSFGR